MASDAWGEDVCLFPCQTLSAGHSAQGTDGDGLGPDTGMLGQHIPPRLQKLQTQFNFSYRTGCESCPDVLLGRWGFRR